MRLASDFNRRNVGAELHRLVVLFTAACRDGNSCNERGKDDNILHGLLS